MPNDTTPAPTNADALRQALELCSAELFAQCADQPRAMQYVEQARAALASAAQRPARRRPAPASQDAEDSI